MAGVTSNPKIQIQLLPAAVVDAFEDRRDLIVGQKGAAGTAAGGDLIRDVHLRTIAEIRSLFGNESELSYRILMWLSGNGGYSPLDVIAVNRVPDADGSEGTIAVSGSPSDSGSVIVSVVDEEKFTVTVDVASTDTADDVAANINTALTNISNSVFSSSVLLSTVTLVALDIGTVGDAYGIKVVSDVPDLIFTITQFTGGTGNPIITNILDVIDGIRYTGISWPYYWNNNLDIPVDLLDDRFNVSDGVMDGVVFMGSSDTFANNSTLAQGENSQSLVLGGNNFIDEDVQKGPAILQPADWTLAYFMGVRARRLTPGAPVADFVIATGGPLDAIGGPSSASLPYFNTPLADTPVTLPVNLYNTEEQTTLEDDGFATFGVNPAGNVMIMGVVPTTWTTDASGNVNVSFHYLNYVDTGSVCREIFFRTLRSTYAQSRLTEGDLIPGRSMANAESIKAELLRIYRVLANQALVQAGREAESYFSFQTTVTVNLANRQVDIAGPLPIVTQLGSINYVLQFSFTVGQTGTQITF